MKNNNKIKALAMFSGGLDSILAVKLLQDQNIDVVGLTCVSCFFDDQVAIKAADQLGIKLITVDFSDEHLEMIKKPKFGYGRNINPCIDCHILMSKKAKEVMNNEGFNFIITGEVLGERPMSQNKQALELIEKEANLKGYLLRPLSAKLLELTIPEKESWVDRKKLLDISGRGRKRQMGLVKEWNIQYYPTPSGGCLLTYFEFSKKLKSILTMWPDCNCNDVRLLKYGRHFWEGENKIVVGRNKEDNEAIDELKKKGDIIIKHDTIPGPTILIRSKNRITEQGVVRAKDLMLKYSPKLKDRLTR
ncbi:MAG: tRNA 4-thiouridine(8) synthase ThiI [bacterium]